MYNFTERLKIGLNWCNNLKLEIKHGKFKTNCYYQQNIS